MTIVIERRRCKIEERNLHNTGWKRKDNRTSESIRERSTCSVSVAAIPGASDRGGKWADKKNFADLVDELHAAFLPNGWILSAAVSPAG